MAIPIEGEKYISDEKFEQSAALLHEVMGRQDRNGGFACIEEIDWSVELALHNCRNSTHLSPWDLYQTASDACEIFDNDEEFKQRYSEIKDSISSHFTTNE
jgi:hypothetical protein